MMIEPSQLSYSTLTALGGRITCIQDLNLSIKTKDTKWALQDLQRLKDKLGSIRTVSSRLLEKYELEEFPQVHPKKG